MLIHSVYLNRDLFVSDNRANSTENCKYFKGCCRYSSTVTALGVIAQKQVAT
jgi:hypothetical protein